MVGSIVATALAVAIAAFGCGVWFGMRFSEGQAARSQSYELSAAIAARSAADLRESERLQVQAAYLDRIRELEGQIAPDEIGACVIDLDRVRRLSSR